MYRYAEVLENTQFALVATVHKLYAMVRSANAWDLGEPELNERGQPVIHSIASKLGCIRPNNDPDLPMGSSVFPENEQDLVELASQLEDHQQKREAEQAVTAAAAAATAQAESQQNDAQTTTAATTTTTAATAIPITMSTSMPTTTAMLASNTNGALDFSLTGRFDRASSSEDFDGFSDMDDYRKNVFGNGNGNGSSVNSASTTMSPQSLSFNDFDVGSNQSDGFAAPSPTMPTTQYTNWMTQTAPIDMPSQQAQQVQQSQQLLQLQQLQQQQQHQRQLQKHQQLLQQQQQRQQQQQQQRQQQQQNYKQAPPLALSIPTTMATSSMPMIGANTSFYATELLRQGLLESNFGAMKPHVIDTPEMMLGVGDPMIYAGDYDDSML